MLTTERDAQHIYGDIDNKQNSQSGFEYLSLHDFYIYWHI